MKTKFEQFGPQERADLYHADRARYDAMRASWLQRGKPLTPVPEPDAVVGHAPPAGSVVTLSLRDAASGTEIRSERVEVTTSNIAELLEKAKTDEERRTLLDACKCYVRATSTGKVA